MGGVGIARRAMGVRPSKWDGGHGELIRDVRYGVDIVPYYDVVSASC